MKLNGNTLKTKVNGKNAQFNEHLRIIANEYAAQPEYAPDELDAKVLDDKSKIDLIERHFAEIMNILGLDLSDDSLKGTPHRVAKMFVKEVFSGLNPDNEPKIKLFENKFNYNQMLVEKDIKLNSYCEHHFVPIIGKVHIGYISNGSVIGLSKINRIVKYYAKRPQLQERLTQQIANELKKALNTEDVAVVIEATHMCVTMRGVEDESSNTTSSSFNGRFLNNDIRNEFFTYLNSSTKLINR
jgi:GTP cyclohydrolase I